MIHLLSSVNNLLGFQRHEDNKADQSKQTTQAYWLFSIVHDAFHLPSPFVNNIKSQYCGSHNSYNVKMQKHFASL